MEGIKKGNLLSEQCESKDTWKRKEKKERRKKPRLQDKFKRDRIYLLDEVLKKKEKKGGEMVDIWIKEYLTRKGKARKQKDRRTLVGDWLFSFFLFVFPLIPLQTIIEIGSIGKREMIGDEISDDGHSIRRQRVYQLDQRWELFRLLSPMRIEQLIDILKKGRRERMKKRMNEWMKGRRKEGRYDWMNERKREKERGEKQDSDLELRNEAVKMEKQNT